MQRNGAQLLLDGVPYRFVGFNAFGIFGGEGLGVWSRAQMDTYFAALQPASMLRTFAFEDYAATTSNFAVLDDLVASAESAGQKLVLCFNNSLSDLVNDGAKTLSWFESGYQAGDWLDWVTLVVSRYRASPAIGMWEVINEAGFSTPENSLDGAMMRSFYQTVAGTIKAADPYHLVSTGDGGEFPYEITAGDDWWGEQAYQFACSAPDIDVLSIHDYELDWGINAPINTHYDPCSGAAATLNKPIMVGEVNRSACSLMTKAQRATVIEERIDNYFTAGANGAMVWNYSQSYYDFCPSQDYTIVTTDPLATAIRGYTFP